MAGRRTARLPQSFIRAVLCRFVCLALVNEEEAAGMLTWPHSAFRVHDAVWVPKDDRAFAARFARYGVRHPVALKALRIVIRAPRQPTTEQSGQCAAVLRRTIEVDPLSRLAWHGAVRIVTFIGHGLDDR